MNNTGTLSAEDNLGLVHACANRFRNRGIEYEELYSAGCIGLVKAVKAFDESRGVKFSTYAVPVILGEIKRLFRDGGTVKVSRSLKELSLKITRERELYVKKYGHEPTVSKLAELAQTDENTVAEAINVSMPPISLTDSSEDNDGQIDVPVEAPDIEIGDILSLRQILAMLDENDRKLIQLRYYNGFTQIQTAEAMSMTQVQVSRKEKKLLLFMREKLLE
ncbi:MAG TPA: flagellar biosynthesis protein FliA [Ruminococcus sp.]|nr:flagellar biosynthesis protein FliA [Ruminococcus sp.]HCR72909.1 flagellar biosynthesis protein FliA [Ruminococcus sp.]